MELLTTAAVISGLVELGKIAVGKASESVGAECVKAAKAYWPKARELLGFKSDPEPEKFENEIGKAVYSQPEMLVALQKLLEEHHQSTLAMRAGSMHSVNRDITSRDFFSINVGNAAAPIHITTGSQDKTPPADPVETDKAAFHACANFKDAEIVFNQPPAAGAIRHLSRFPGKWSLRLNWSGGDDPFAPEAFRGIQLGNVAGITFGWMAIHWYLQEFVRGDTGLTSLDWISFHNLNHQLSDAALGILAQPESGLKSLTRLYAGNTHITDAAVMELTRNDTALKGLKLLDLSATHITDAALLALAHPDSGLKSLTHLDLDSTKATDAGLIELARPGSTLNSLKSLSLRCTQVSDAFLRQLSRPDSSLRALTSLNLEHTEVTSEAIQSLKNARPTLCLNATKL